MAILETAAILILVVLMMLMLFIFLRTPNQRTLFRMSIPAMNRGKVLNINLTPERTIEFDLVRIDENQLKKKDVDHPDAFLNKDIEKGTMYVEATSGKPTYFSVPGSLKTVDPARGADPAALDDRLARKLISLGEKRAEHRFKKSGQQQETIAGISPAVLALVVVVAIIGIAAALWIFAGQIAELSAVHTLAEV